VGYPLTVHGTGGQAFIHIRTRSAASTGAEEPTRVGDRVKILNQMTEPPRAISPP
jgi:hypothetical protein